MGETRTAKAHNNENESRSSLMSTPADSMTEKCTVSFEPFEELKEAELLEHQRQIRVIIAYIAVTLFALACVALIILFVVVPIIFAHWVYVQRLAMFTNIGLPSDKDYFNTIKEHPKLLFRNFHIDFQDSENQSISLGVWHLLAYAQYPNETESSTSAPTSKHQIPEPIDYDAMLRNNSVDVVIYFHGSGEIRRDALMMYNVLLQFFHVVAFDYRDYGDSTPAILSERAVVEDAQQVFRWVRHRTNRRIYVWGHSLGTPLSTLTINYLQEDVLPHGLILESPMTNMDEEIGQHPYGKLFSWLPWFTQTIRNPLKQNGFLFATDEYILNVSCPIMILHAEDDSIIPYTLGKKLAQIATDQRPKDVGNVTYVQFPAKLHFDHFRIWNSKLLYTLIPNFTVICDEYYNKTHKIPRQTSTTTLYHLDKNDQS